MTYGGGDVRSTMSRMGATQKCVAGLEVDPPDLRRPFDHAGVRALLKGPIWKTSSVPVTKNGA
jgi:hypothetical protein